MTLADITEGMSRMCYVEEQEPFGKLRVKDLTMCCGEQLRKGQQDA